MGRAGAARDGAARRSIRQGRASAALPEHGCHSRPGADSLSAPLLVRAAREHDLDAIVRLIAADDLERDRERVEHPPPPASVAAFHEIDRDPRPEPIVAERDGVVVATAQLDFLPSLRLQGGERAQVAGVRVASSERGRGVGRLLLEEIVARAARRGCLVVRLTTDKRRSAARRFSEALGFEATHHGMKLRLPRAT